MGMKMGLGMKMRMGMSIPPRAQGWLCSPAPPCVRLTAVGAGPDRVGMSRGCTTTPQHPGALGDETPVPSPESPRGQR